MIDIEDNFYFGTLNKYAVLSDNGLTTINDTTIGPGVYGTHTGNVTGNFMGTLDNNNAALAQSDLSRLVDNINNFISGISSISISTQTSPITLYPNINYNSTSTISFIGPITIDSQGDPDAYFFITAGTLINFNNVPSITLTNGTKNCRIFWMAPNISFTGTSPPIIPGNFIASLQITVATDANICGRLYAQSESIYISGTTCNVNEVCYTQTEDDPILPVADPILSNVLSTLKVETKRDHIACYTTGTLILTPGGFVPIENIKTGQRVLAQGKIFKNSVVRDNSIKIEKVIWISKFKISALNSSSRPICITKDALGKHQPFIDLRVSPNHGILLNGRLVPVKNIVNGTTIYQDTDCNEVEYYHIECENHMGIYANGILSESYLEKNNRDVFEKSKPKHLNIVKRVNLKRILRM